MLNEHKLPKCPAQINNWFPDLDTTLQRALRTAPDGLPQVSTYTILRVLHEAGWSWQQTRSWCDTGTVLRQRKAGVVTVTDPASDEKKGS